MTAPAPEKIESAVAHLCARDPVLKRAFSDTGLPEWRAEPNAYVTLARIIAFQQISTKAAAAIWTRVCEGLGEIEPETMSGASEEALRSYGLSRPKLRHMKSVAEAVLSGDLSFERLAAHTLDDARAELVAVKGIGPWTAEVFCLYAKGALDAFPHNDIGLSESWKQLSNAQERPDHKQFGKIGAKWAPYRGVAAHMLWFWLNAKRAQERVAGNPTP